MKEKWEKKIIMFVVRFYMLNTQILFWRITHYYFLLLLLFFMFLFDICCWNHSNEWWNSLAVALFVNNRVRVLFFLLIQTDYSGRMKKIAFCCVNRSVIHWDHSTKTVECAVYHLSAHRFNMLNWFLCSARHLIRSKGVYSLGNG